MLLKWDLKGRVTTLFVISIVELCCRRLFQSLAKHLLRGDIADCNSSSLPKSAA